MRRIFKLRQITNWFVIVEGRGLHFRKHLCVKDMKLTCLYNLETKGAFQKSELAGRTRHFQNEIGFFQEENHVLPAYYLVFE